MVNGWKPNNMTFTTSGSKRPHKDRHADFLLAEMCLRLGSLETTLHFPCPHSGTVGSLDQLMGSCPQQTPSERTTLNCSQEDPEDRGKDIGGNSGVCTGMLSSQSAGELWRGGPSSPLMEWTLSTSTYHCHSQTLRRQNQALWEWQILGSRLEPQAAHFELNPVCYRNSLTLFRILNSLPLRHSSSQAQ